MNIAVQVLSIITSVALLFILFDLLRRGRLRERHIAWWLLGGFIALLLSIFPQVLASVSIFLGFEVPANLVFFVTIALLFLVNIQTSSELTALEERTRILAERVALLELKTKDR
jgi:hypothetical protein